MISFIYFDIGGVMIKDFSATNKWDEMKKDMGVNATNKVLYEQLWAEHAERVDLDQDIDTLIPLLRSRVGLSLSENYSWLNDFVDRFEPNYSLWTVIDRIKQKYRMGLLTNMYPRMLTTIQASGLLPPVEWDSIIDSSVEGCKKPNREIFDIAQTRAEVPANEILFIDNAQKNIDAAADLGWQTFYYDSSNYEQSTNLLVQTILKGV